MKEMENLQRCPWCGSDPLYVEYHDTEWGVPEKRDEKLFEFLILEGMQAGLSWITILKKRENFRKAFQNFNPEKIARYGEKKVESLLQDGGIIRNKLKINGAIANAKAFLKIQEKGSFSDYLWNFTDHKALQNRWKSLEDLPPRTELSDQISTELKKQGFKFVGSTIVYAHLQATGMVNDHLVSCFRHKEVKALGKKI